jgi:hypothetical protein
LNLEKIKNPIYLKIRTNITVDARKEVIRKASATHKKCNSQEKKKSEGKDNKEVKTKQAGNNNLSIDTGSPKKLKKISISNSNRDSSSVLKTETSPLSVDYSINMPRGKTLRTSTPYKTESKRNYEEYLKNKEKWLIKKGFDFNFGKLDFEKKTIIPNYVFVSPSKIPIFRYQFREVNKDKWINKSPFIYKNSHDLVI